MKEFVKKNKVLVVGIIALVIVLSLVIIINTTNKKLDKETKYNNSYKPNYDEELKLGDVLFNSTDVNYDNTDSGLSSTTVKEAIDELYDNLLQKECAIGYSKAKTERGIYTCAKICVRAEEGTLHTEKCNLDLGTNDYYCLGDGYYAEGSKGTTTVTFGSIWDGVSALKAGDAFDCDVNGDGTYDATTERFYYVGPYFNTDTQTFDDETGYATLIYYRNYKNGSPSDAGVAYYAPAEENWHGPTTAIAALPSNKTNGGTWRDDLLKTTDRRMLSCKNASCTQLSDKTNNGGQALEYTPSIYNGKAARLLTLKELARGCGTGIASNSGITNAGCNFIFERTKYINYNYPAWGVMFESPHFIGNNVMWRTNNQYRNIDYSQTTSTGYGVRPTIDIKYSDLLY